MAEALLRGEEHRARIALTIGREMLRETDYAESPFGVVGRAKQKLGIEKKGEEE